MYSLLSGAADEAQEEEEEGGPNKGAEGDIFNYAQSESFGRTLVRRVVVALIKSRLFGRCDDGRIQAKELSFG